MSGLNKKTGIPARCMGVAAFCAAVAIASGATAGWPEFRQESRGSDVPIEEQLPDDEPPVARPARPDPSAAIIPAPVDDRCMKFGWNPSGKTMIPVAWPLVLDLTRYGTLKEDAVRLSDSLAEYLTMTGAFSVNTRDAAPVGGALSWISPIAFDYLGWRAAGNWMVVTATISPALEGDDGVYAGDNPGEGSELVHIVISTYLTEEGDVLEISNARATLPRSALTSFAARYVNAVSVCITGVAGAAESRIAYARKATRNGSKEIWVTRVGSGQQTQISFDGSLAMLPAWGPGGSVAWTGYRDGNPDIYLDGRRLGTRGGMNTGVAWAPDGTRAALTWAPEAAPDIYLVSPKTGEVTKRLTESPAIDTSPAWSPDSKQIAFVSDRGGTPNIYVMNSDGSGTKPLPITGEYNTGPDWSPDGSTILYQSRGAGSRFSIWAYDIATRTSRRISQDRFNNEEPSWSPDGRFIAYTSTREGRKQLYIMNRDGSGARPVFSDGAEYFTPAWERMIPARTGR